MKESEIKGLGFEKKKSYYHDQFYTVVYAKGELEVDFTYQYRPEGEGFNYKPQKMKLEATTLYIKEEQSLKLFDRTSLKALMRIIERRELADDELMTIGVLARYVIFYAASIAWIQYIYNWITQL